MKWKEWKHYQRNTGTIIPALANALIEGQLSLMLGAGVSAGFRLPQWSALVKAVCERINPILATKGATAIEVKDIVPETDGKDLLRKMSLLRSKLCDDAAYLEAVKAELYKRWGTPHPSIFSMPGTLRAISMLVSGSRRGRVENIINFNFDSILEWCLSEHGLVVSVIEDLPKPFVSADVRIFHPHGYLPFSTSYGCDSGMILLDDAKMWERFSDRNDPWMDFYRVFLTNTKFLAIGLGFKDPMVEAALAAASFVMRRASGDEPIGFWIAKKATLKEEEIASLNGYKIVVLEIDDFIDIRKILQSIVRDASEKVKF